MWKNIHWSTRMRTIQLILLLGQVITLCNASCGVETCDPPHEFSYEACRDFNVCLMNPHLGGCTKRDRNLLMAPHCSCYMQCERSFTLLHNNLQRGHCYFRGLLDKCLKSNHACQGITSKYLKNFAAECPCNIGNCLDGLGAYPFETSCYNHLMCIGGGPVASNAAGCSSADAVRKNMKENELYISNPNGTWILKKKCYCENSCPEETFNLLPTCSRIQELISCYERVGCSIKRFKKKLAPCTCNYLCKSEIEAMNSNRTNDAICKSATLNYEACGKKYGCQRKILNLCSTSSTSSGNGLHSSKYLLLTTIMATLLIPYIKKWEGL